MPYSVPESLFQAIPNLQRVRRFFDGTFLLKTEYPSACCPRFDIENDEPHESHLLLDTLMGTQTPDCSSYLEEFGYVGPALFAAFITEIEGAVPRGIRVELPSICILCRETCNFGCQQLMIIKEDYILDRICATPVCLEGKMAFLCWNICFISRASLKKITTPAFQQYADSKHPSFFPIYFEALQASRPRVRCIKWNHTKWMRAENCLGEGCTCEKHRGVDDDLQFPADFDEEVARREQTKFSLPDAEEEEPDTIRQLRPTPSKRQPKKKTAAAAANAADIASEVCNCADRCALFAACSHCQRVGLCQNATIAEWQRSGGKENKPRTFTCSCCGVVSHRLPRFYEPDAI